MKRKPDAPFPEWFKRSVADSDYPWLLGKGTDEHRRLANSRFMGVLEASGRYWRIGVGTVAEKRIVLPIEAFQIGDMWYGRIAFESSFSQDGTVAKMYSDKDCVLLESVMRLNTEKGWRPTGTLKRIVIVPCEADRNTLGGITLRRVETPGALIAFLFGLGDVCEWSIADNPGSTGDIAG